MIRRQSTAGAIAALAFACSSVAVASPGSSDPSQPYGLWQNPAHTLKVKLQPCGQKLCGSVAWASPTAISDAHKSGYTQSVVGTELLQDYVPDGRGQWKGRVFIPDMHGTFYSKIRAIDAGTLDISGCVLGGLICRHQTWKRA